MNNNMTAEFMEQFAEMMKSSMPTVKLNKNGYEIRTKVLEFAQSQVWQDYHAKFNMIEQTIRRDPNTGEIVNTVTFPEVPGTENVLEAAQQFYDFVSNGKIKKD